MQIREFLLFTIFKIFINFTMTIIILIIIILIYIITFVALFTLFNIGALGGLSILLFFIFAIVCIIAFTIINMVVGELIMSLFYFLRDMKDKKNPFGKLELFLYMIISPFISAINGLNVAILDSSPTVKIDMLSY